MPDHAPVRRSEKLTFVLTPDERDALERLAREQDSSVARIVRQGVRNVLAESMTAFTVTRSERA